MKKEGCKFVNTPRGGSGEISVGLSQALQDSGNGYGMQDKTITKSQGFPP